MSNTIENRKHSSKLAYNTSRTTVAEIELGTRAHIATDTPDAVDRRLFEADKFQHQFG